MAKTKVTQADLKKATYSGPLMTAADFAKQEGQKISGGGNVLIIPENSGAGPFVITAMAEKTLNKKYDPVMVWTGADSDGVEYSLPAATSFVAKATEAKLEVGETVCIFRNADYKANGKMCASYQLAITSRPKPVIKAKGRKA